MKSSQQDLFIDMVVDRFILNDHRSTLSLCFTFIPEKIADLRERVVSVYRE